MTDVDKCICCGAPVPEGRQICIKCASTQTEGKCGDCVFWEQSNNPIYGYCRHPKRINARSQKWGNDKVERTDYCALQQPKS